ncbi:heavy metal transporter [Streptomyces sp. NBC_00286]|uniref:heavy metal transporter n=1 Tax=Streptomyces sp. NBC_00286 TaxID=2975701 RepID=UPI002E29BB3E|nr:heavy metal transporter [Streptomyces sp. NBC_00286]
MREPTSNVRRRRLPRFGTALAMLLALAAYLTFQYVSGGTGAPRCTVVSDRGDGASYEYEFTAEQAVNAATISVVGTNRGMPERAVTIALATALQESGLRNIDHGDRDSLGLFQQRPSQGWGTETQVMDPAYAASEFYEHLAKVPDYAELPLTVAAQRVQRSGFPDAYAKHETDAGLLAAALTGRAAGTLTCEGRPDMRPEQRRQVGPDAVRAALVRDFGQDMFQAAGAERKLGPETGATPSDASSGAGGPANPRTVTIPVPDAPATKGGQRQRGWGLAHWAVANASALHIKRVSYAGRVWIAGHTRSEWRAEASKSRNSTDEVRVVTGR